MAARKLYFESLRVGDELPAVAKAPIDRVQLCRYAGASGDYNPLHTDEPFAKEVAGFPTVFGHGMLTMGATAKVLTDWFGDGKLLRYGVRFLKQVWPGDRLVAKATAPMRLEGDPSLQRTVDVPVLRGDYSRLNKATGWEPEIDLDQTLTDLLQEWRDHVRR